MYNRFHNQQKVFADSADDSSLDCYQRVPQVGLYPEDSPDCGSSSLYTMEDRSMQYPDSYRSHSKKMDDDKSYLSENPTTDSGVGLDSGCGSLYQSSGYLSSGSRLQRISPLTSTDSLEKQITHLNIHDQQDSLLRESSVIKSFLSGSYVSGTTSETCLCDQVENEDPAIAEINEIVSFPPRENYWHAVFHSDEDGDTKLHLAIIQRAPEVYNMLSLSTSHHCVNVKNEQFYQTPLHLAVLTTQSHVARTLMAWGAQVSAQDHHGDTPLHIACRKGDFDCVRVLTTPVGYEETRDVPYSIPFQRVPQGSIFNYTGQTCLHLAGANNHLAIVQYLVEVCAADMNAKDYTAGRTVLHGAVEARNIALVRLLVCLRHHGLDIEADNFAGRTPLQLAVDNDLQEIACILMEAGASQDNVETDGSLDLAMDDDSDDDLCSPLEYDDLSIYGQPITLDPSMFGPQ